MRASLAIAKIPGANGSGGAAPVRSRSTADGIEAHGFCFGSPQTERANAAPVAEHAPGLAKGSCGIRHEHVAPAAEDPIDASVVHVHPLGVEGPELGI